ncbi:MAG: hypothetical protein RL266_1022 [Bacteroidota bacterium]
MNLPRQISLSVLLILSSICTSAQELEFASYNWQDTPEFGISNIDTSIDEMVLLQKTMYEYYFKGDDFLEHYTWHKATYVNSDKAIEANNKIYIPANATVENLTEKVRVFQPNGDVVELTKKDVQKYENEEEGTSYRYFAVEGIEKGSVIELLIQQTRVPVYQGVRLFFQNSIPTAHASMEMVSPRHLHYVFKSYNGLADVQSDTNLISKGKHHYFLRADSVPKMSDDDQAGYNANRQFIIYKLDKNTASNTNDYTSYGKVAQNVYANVYNDVSKASIKKMKSLINDAKLNLSRSEEDKVRTLEEHVKRNFRVVNSNAAVLSKLDFILENSVCSEWGITYLMGNLLKQLEIEHELVITSDRSELRFDKTFEAHVFLTELLIYIPKFNKYLAPGWPLLRLGIVPSECAGNNGLFISEVKVGDFVSAVGEVKKIPETVHTENRHDLDVSVDMTEDVYNPKIHIKTEVSGYNAQYLQPIFQYLNSEQKEESLEGQLKYIDSEGKFTNVVSSNDRSYHFGVKPMIIEGDLETNSFSEMVGNDVLFKVGMLIGPQMEMYQEEESERTIDVESEFAREYKRVLTISLPEGYDLTNAETLKMDFRYSDDKGYEMAFVSDYELKDGKLVVNVHEYYKNQTYPKALFGEYKRVINAAADFNKLTIVLKKA